MTDQPEKKSETEDVDADFEGHRLSGAGEDRASSATSPTSKAANEDDGADFEGHRLVGPEKLGVKADAHGRQGLDAFAPRVGSEEAPAGASSAFRAARSTASGAAAAPSRAPRAAAAPRRRPRCRSSSAAIRATTAAPPSPCSATARARRAVWSRSSPIAAWFANMISRSISPSENAPVLGAVEHLQHAEHRVAVRERHRHQALRHVARALGRLAREARILLEVVDHDRLAGDEHPARDARARGNPHPDQVALALAGDGLEDELVRRRRRAGRSTTPWRRRSPARRRRSTAAARDGSPPTGASRSRRPPGSSSHRSCASSCVRCRQVEDALQLEGRQPRVLREHERRRGRRCAARRSCCRSPGACCRRTTPRRGRRRGRRTRPAGWGSRTTRAESSPSWRADRDDRREAPRIALDRHVVRRGDEHRAAEVGGVGELVEELGELALRRREAEVDDLEALLDRVAEAAEDQVGAAGVALAEHADAVDPAGRRQRADDSGAGGAVPADVADRRRARSSSPRRRASRRPRSRARRRAGGRRRRRCRGCRRRRPRRSLLRSPSPS